MKVQSLDIQLDQMQSEIQHKFDHVAHQEVVFGIVLTAPSPYYITAIWNLNKFTHYIDNNSMIHLPVRH